jgi:hypothetical protein
MMRITIRTIIVAVATMIVVACASAPRAANRGASCPLIQTDSAFLARGAVYRACAVDIAAKKIPVRSRLDFTPSVGKCYAVEVEFVVDSLGKPERETARVIRSTDRTYEQAIMATIQDWRYAAAVLDHHPVRQIVYEKPTMTVMASVSPGPPPTALPPTC